MLFRSAAGVTVTATIAVDGPPKAVRQSETRDLSDVVVWLKPVRPDDTPAPPSPAARARYRIVQQNKRFEPRLLVVPVGSTVDFPNLDPFYHNVFSLFDGRRFDLGLYEAGRSRSVDFSRAGVSYVFCNIHPEMSAVVVSVDTPYFGVSTRGGAVSVSGVPPGRYALSVWHERFAVEHAADYPRDVTVSADGPSLGILRLVDSGRVIGPHTNKFGQEYHPPTSIGAPYR